MQKDSREPPPNWPWPYRVEWRLMRLEERAFNETTDRAGGPRKWLARDWLMTGAGITLVLGALSERSGLTAVGTVFLKALVHLYGSR